MWLYNHLQLVVCVCLEHVKITSNQPERLPVEKFLENTN